MIVECRVTSLTEKRSQKLCQTEEVFRRYAGPWEDEVQIRGAEGLADHLAEDLTISRW